MLQKILKMYLTAMAGDVRSPIPHLFGPPGCGKSESVEQAADLLGVNLHIVNVSRINPLELEGYQMPDADNTRLNLLTATLWTQLKGGDIVLLDEFLRGFPEVYNGLLDIMTSRQVAGFKLPKVFFIAASNSVVAYDKALEDRLLHICVPDLRSSKLIRNRTQQLIVDELGLLPSIVKSTEMQDLIHQEVEPMYEILDMLENRANIATQQVKGVSVRNLLGQARLREVHSKPLKDLLKWNNSRAISEGKPQYLYIVDEATALSYLTDIEKVQKFADKLTPLQRQNLDMNVQLLELALIDQQERKEKEDDLFFNE